MHCLDHGAMIFEILEMSMYVFATVAISVMSRHFKHLVHVAYLMYWYM